MSPFPLNKTASEWCKENIGDNEMKDMEQWRKYEDANDDPYGKACVDVARKVMEYLDSSDFTIEKGYYPNLNTPHGMIQKADEELKAGGLTGFMASAVASMIYQCHEKGEEFWEAFK